MAKKLKTTIDYTFGEQEDFPQISIDMKYVKKKNTIKIVQHKFAKKDPSTKLF